MEPNPLTTLATNSMVTKTGIPNMMTNVTKLAMFFKEININKILISRTIILRIITSYKTIISLEIKM